MSKKEPTIPSFFAQINEVEPEVKRKAYDEAQPPVHTKLLFCGIKFSEKIWKFYSMSRKSINYSQLTRHLTIYNFLPIKYKPNAGSVLIDTHKNINEMG